MSYTDKKITTQQKEAAWVQSADDVLMGDADDNKEVFDKFPVVIMNHFNDLVDALDTHDGNVDDDLSTITTKLATIEEYAEVNVQSDWTQDSNAADDYIKNKPPIDKGTGNYAVVEGYANTASGNISHAEGNGNTASGDYSHAEGRLTEASGDYSHAQNFKTIAKGTAQTALGAWNVEDNSDTYLLIVGNGQSDDDRSNALTVKWNGDVNAAGDITDGSGHTLSDALTSETDPVFSASVAAGITSEDISTWNGKSDFSGDYDDLTNKPTIPTDTSDLTNGAGFLTSESDPVFSASEAAGITSTDIANWNAKLSSESDPVFTASAAAGITSTDISNWNGKQDALVSGTNIKTINNTSLLGSGNIDIQGGGGGGTKNVWYATCSTGASTQAKVATTTSNDFALVNGNMVRVLFTNGNSYNGTATLNVDGAGAKNITRAGGTTTRYYWTAGEVVDFVYNGSTFDMVAKGTATTTYYGLTKLSSSTSSTSEALAATPKAVKTAYDLANGKSDFSGSYTDLTDKPTIPTDTGDLTNGAGYLTDSDLVNLIYPIGSIYMSVNNVSPQTFLGGTWQEINGRFLVAQGDNGESGDEALDLSAGATGGYTDPQNSAHSHGAGTLAADSKNLAHTHTLNNHTHGAGTLSVGPSGHKIKTTSPALGSGGSSRNIVSSSGTLSSSAVTDGHTISGSTGSSNVASGAMSANEAHGHTISGYTESISAVASGNLPPYLAVYMWKRTA